MLNSFNPEIIARFSKGTVLALVIGV